MEFWLILIMIGGFSLLGGLVWWQTKQLKQQQLDSNLLEWLKSTQVQLDSHNRNFNESLFNTSQHIATHLQSNTKALNERLDRAAQQFATISKEIGQLSEIGRSMQEFQSFLKSPKIRGNIGEEILKDLISQMFPKNAFYLQYAFRSGEKVDAAIRTDAGILPIDSKFPMENFRKLLSTENESEKSQYQKLFVSDVKKHISSISKKYILPSEGTMDFALMYIPSEAIYYEIVNLPEINDFARKHRVYPVSPTTLYAHLQMILLSFEGKKIESRARQLFNLLHAVQQEYQKVDSDLGVLGKHMSNAQSKLQEVFHNHQSLGHKLNQTQLLEEPTDSLPS